MERIKNWSEVKSGRKDSVFVEIVSKKESMIIMPEEGKNKTLNWDYAKVISVGSEVGDIKEGDIILNYDGGAAVFEAKGKKYGVLQSFLCTVVVASDNFEA